MCREYSLQNQTGYTGTCRDARGYLGFRVLCEDGRPFQGHLGFVGVGLQQKLGLFVRGYICMYLHKYPYRV